MYEALDAMEVMQCGDELRLTRIVGVSGVGYRATTQLGLD
jgi:hypothetical protein